MSIAYPTNLIIASATFRPCRACSRMVERSWESFFVVLWGYQTNQPFVYTFSLLVFVFCCGWLADGVYWIAAEVVQNFVCAPRSVQLATLCAIVVRSSVDRSLSCVFLWDLAVIAFSDCCIDGRYGFWGYPHIASVLLSGALRSRFPRL